jgi:hypothetical protein
MDARILLYDLRYIANFYRFYNSGKSGELITMSNSIEVVLRFEEHINACNVEAICALMTSDGEFIDSLGNRIQGLAKLRSAWEGYSRWSLIIPSRIRRYSLTEILWLSSAPRKGHFPRMDGSVRKISGRLPRHGGPWSKTAKS